MRPLLPKSDIRVKRTGNPYGVTLSGRLYMEPEVGMPVVFAGHFQGRITEIRKPMHRNGDPEVEITTDEGRKVYLFQTALNGYHPLKSLTTEERVKKGNRLTVQLRRACLGRPVTCDHCQKDLLLAEAYRCAECHFWFHLECIWRHFKES